MEPYSPMEHALTEIDALDVAATKNLHYLGPFHCVSWASQVGVRTGSTSVTWDRERVYILRLLHRFQESEAHLYFFFFLTNPPDRTLKHI